MNVFCQSKKPCPLLLDSTCVIYEGGNLVYTGISTNDSLSVALEKIDLIIGQINVVSAGIPNGGGINQVLAKKSNIDYDTEWVSLPDPLLTFIELTDTPDNYTGQANKVVSVKTDESGLEFTDVEPPILQENISVSNSDLGLTLPFTFTQGTTLTDAWKQLVQKTFNPTLIAPTFSLSNSAGLRVIGSSSNFTLTFNFNRGNIQGALVSGVWNPTTSQGFRAGAASSYTLNGVTQAGNSLVISGYTVIQGNNTFTGTVTYDTGVQPLNSKDEPFGAPFIGGTSAVQSTSFEGVYPLFATTVNITTATQQALVSMLTATNIQITLVAESGGNKQFFEIPDAWLATRPLVSVQYFNALSGQFDTTNKIADFAVTSVTETVEGNSIGYKRYTYTGADRGSLLIRLLF